MIDCKDGSHSASNNTPLMNKALLMSTELTPSQNVEHILMSTTGWNSISGCKA